VEDERAVRERAQEEKLDELLNSAKMVSSALEGEADRAAALNGKRRSRPISLPDLRERKDEPEANGEKH